MNFRFLLNPYIILVLITIICIVIWILAPYWSTFIQYQEPLNQLAIFVLGYLTVLIPSSLLELLGSNLLNNQKHQLQDLSLTDLLVSHKTGRIFEEAEYIKITRNTVKFGSSVYQFKNVTGIKVGQIPKESFPWTLVIGLIIGGVLTLTLEFVIGWFLLIGAAFFAIKGFNQQQYYGLSIFFNSGQEIFFKSNDKAFLMDVIDTLYRFMEENIGENISIDMSNRSINITSDFHGSRTGDSSIIY